MRRFEGKDIDDPLNKFLLIFFQEISDNIIIILKDLIQAIMDSIFFKLNGMIKNIIDPFLTDIEFCNTVSFDYLPNEVVSLIKDCLQCIVFLFWCFVDLS